MWKKKKLDPYLKQYTKINSKKKLAQKGSKLNIRANTVTHL